jgi:hypothetical protein
MFSAPRLRLDWLGDGLLLANKLCHIMQSEGLPAMFASLPLVSLTLNCASLVGVPG